MTRTRTNGVGNDRALERFARRVTEQSNTRTLDTHKRNAGPCILAMTLPAFPEPGSLWETIASRR